MDRRNYLLSLGAVTTLAGCNEESPSETEPSGDGGPEDDDEVEDGENGDRENGEERDQDTEQVDSADNPGEILSLDEIAIEGENESTEIGDELEVAYTATLPVTDGLYDAIVEIELLDVDEEVIGSDLLELADVADSDSQTVRSTAWIPTNNLEDGDYAIRVRVEDYISGETVSEEHDGISLVYPDAEDREAVNDHIQTIRNLLDEAISEFESRGSGSMTGVSAEDTDTSMRGIIDIVLPIDRELRDAREYEVAEELYQEELEQLELEFEIVRHLVRVQRAFFETIEQTYDLFERFEMEDANPSSYDWLLDGIKNLSERLYADGSGLEELVNSASRGDETVGDYETKFEQFDAEFDDIKQIEAAAKITKEATDYLDDARRKFETERYNETQLDADEAEFQYQNASGEIEDITELTTTKSNLKEIVDELALTARDIRREAAAEADN